MCPGLEVSGLEIKSLLGKMDVETFECNTGDVGYINMELIEDKNCGPAKDKHALRNGCEDTWSWNRRDRSQEALLSGGNRTVHFHPNWSKGTAGIRGTRTLNNGRYYWELKLSDRIFGTR